MTSLVQKSGLCFILLVVPLQSCMNVHKINKINPVTVTGHVLQCLFFIYGLKTIESRWLTARRRSVSHISVSS